MRGKSITVLLAIVFCFAISDVCAGFASNHGPVSGIDFAAARDVDDDNFGKITTLNLLVGSIGITFSGWLLRKRRTS